MVFGIAGDLDVEPVAGFLADELDQLVRVAQLAARREPRRQVAAQRDDVAYAAARGSARAGPCSSSRDGGDAGKVRRGVEPGGADLEHRLQRALRVEPPAPKVTEKNLGLSCPSCFQVSRSFALPSGVFGREELEAEGALEFALRLQDQGEG